MALFFAIVPLFAQNNSNMPTGAFDVENLKQNYISLILSKGEDELIQRLIELPREMLVSDQMVVELMQRYPADPKDVNTILQNQLADGSWPDIDYNTTETSGWQPKRHLERLLLMCKQYRFEKSSFYQSEQLESAISRALDFWFDKKVVCIDGSKRVGHQRDWWYNDIGIPKALAPIFILFEDRMSPTQKAEAIQAMAASKIGTTGQNKVWLSGNVLVRGLLENNYDLIKQARDTIVSMIVMGPTGPREEGIQYDYSYHQHGKQQQFGNYGAAFIADMSFWARTFAGTSLVMEQNQLDILSDLINKGFQRIIWKGNMDVNCLGRQFFKQSQRHKALSVAFSGNALANVDSKNKDQYEGFLKSAFKSTDEVPGMQGVYHFRNSDQTVCRRPLWMTSVRMSSTRTIGGEAGNSDNKKGYYMSDGSTYTYVDGDEYNNIFPVWDWRKLPGTTAFESEEPLKKLTFGGYRSQSDFVGNVNDGETGMTVMQLVRDGLTAQKSWIFTENYVLCLGTGITTDSACVVTTSIEQCLKKCDLLRLNKKKWTPVGDTELTDSNEVRFFHHKTGYIIFQTDKTFASSESRTDSWYDIMGMYPEDMKETREVVSLWVDHGSKPQSAQYQYMILPATTAALTARFDTKSIQVLSNTKEAQVIYLPKEKKVFIAAYSTLSMQLPHDLNFSCEQPGLFLIQYQPNGNKTKIICSDPTQKLSFLDIEIDGEKERINL